MAQETFPPALAVETAATAAPKFGGLSARVSLMYAAIYLHYGAFGLFIPLWFKHRGLTPEQIGTLMSLPLILRVLFVAPVTGLADRLRRIREVLLACVLGAMLMISVMSFAHAYWQLLLFFTIFSLVWDPLPILADSYAVLGVRAKGLDFGRMRLWGSIGFIAANVASGSLIGTYSPEIIPFFTAALLAVPIIPILLLPPDRSLGEHHQQPQRLEWRKILGDRGVIGAMIATALVGSSHVVMNTFGAIQFTEKGFSGTTIGLLVAASIAAEIVVLFIAKALLGQRSPLWLIALAGAGAIIRWIAMAFSPDIAVVFALQMLNGFTGMGAMAGLMMFLAQRVDERLIATAQGINAVVLGVLAAMATLGAGYAWAAMGVQAYWLAAGVAGLGLLWTLMLLRERR